MRGRGMQRKQRRAWEREPSGEPGRAWEKVQGEEEILQKGREQKGREQTSARQIKEEAKRAGK